STRRTSRTTGATRSLVRARSDPTRRLPRWREWDGWPRSSTSTRSSPRRAPVWSTRAPRRDCPTAWPPTAMSLRPWGSRFIIAGFVVFFVYQADRAGRAQARDQLESGVVDPAVADRPWDHLLPRSVSDVQAKLRVAVRHSAARQAGHPVLGRSGCGG